jgi:hypothetical protein
MLDTLTADDFSSQLGKTFTVRLADRPPLDLTLLEARRLSRTTAATTGRPPFSVLFRGPREPVLLQRIYALENEAMGRLEIFLVPVGPDATGMQYEAIFN